MFSIQQKNVRKICSHSFGLLFLTPVLFISAFFLASEKFALAGVSDSLFGWAWSGSESVSDGVMNGNETGIGWISMNSSDCDANGDGLIDVSGCGSLGSPISNYGVNVPFADGPITGYAWSTLVGWISFNPADLAGCTPILGSAQRSGNNIIGGARILSIRDAGSYSGGYDGCISLATPTPVTASDVLYGVRVSTAGDTLEGYAWSSDFGWIDFSGVSIAGPLGSLSSPGCSIEEGESSCSTTLSWSVSNVVDGYITENGTTIQSGISSNGSDSITLNFINKTYRLIESTGNILDSVTLRANCAGTLQPNEVGNCAVVPPSPILTLRANPAMVRSGTPANIIATINANYDLECFFSNAIQPEATQTINHPASPNAVQEYIRLTRELTAAQLIRLTCPVPGFETTLPPTVVETRVEVVPTYQEI